MAEKAVWKGIYNDCSQFLLIFLLPFLIADRSTWNRFERGRSGPVRVTQLSRLELIGIFKEYHRFCRGALRCALITVCRRTGAQGYLTPSRNWAFSGHRLPATRRNAAGQGNFVEGYTKARWHKPTCAGGSRQGPDLDHLRRSHRQAKECSAAKFRSDLLVPWYPKFWSRSRRTSGSLRKRWSCAKHSAMNFTAHVGPCSPTVRMRA